MKSKASFLILLIGHLLSSGVCAQNQTEMIKGILLDSTTEEPVVFATIRLKDRAVGVISNIDGSFQIPERFRQLEEILEISCLGYKTKEVKFSGLSKTDKNIIGLEPTAFELQETTVTAKRKRPPSPRKIIKRAIDRIPDNYSLNPFSYVGYYRDYQQKDNEYLNLNEAIIRVFDLGFGNNDYRTTESQLYQFRKNLDFKLDEDSENPYDYSSHTKIIDNARVYSFGGNEFFILRIHDAIRNYKVRTFSYVDVLERDLLRNHRLTRKRDITLGGEKMFVIELSSSNSRFVDPEYIDNKAISQLRAKGEIFISQTTYAIHKLSYQMFDFTPSKSDKNKSRTEQENLLFSIAIEYRKHNEKLYPNYLSLHNTFKVNKSYFRVEDVLFDLGQKRFEIRTNNSPIFKQNRNQPNIVLRYKKRKIPLKDFVKSGNGILVYPNEKKIEEILEELNNDLQVGESLPMDVFEFEFYNILDENGNELNDYFYEEYGQYREFFTQQISDTLSLPSGESFMKKGLPLFTDQPIITPENINDFWMNTPLKSIKEQSR